MNIQSMVACGIIKNRKFKKIVYKLFSAGDRCYITWEMPGIQELALTLYDHSLVFDDTRVVYYIRYIEVAAFDYDDPKFPSNLIGFL